MAFDKMYGAPFRDGPGAAAAHFIDKDQPNKDDFNYLCHFGGGKL